METPSSISMRKVLTSATSNNNTSMLLMSMGKNGQSERRSALLDITNDSPIVGLAVEPLPTPPTTASTSKKNSTKVEQTPGSGEALLRGQVKSLLQKIEEEGGELLKPLDRNPAARFQCLAGSPALCFLAPTPANTPLVGDDLSDNALTDEDQNEIPKRSAQEEEEEVDIDMLVSPLTRALLFDSPRKSDISSASIVSSELTYEGSLKSPDEEELSSSDELDDYEGEEEDCDELCSGMNRIRMEEG